MRFDISKGLFLVFVVFAVVLSLRVLDPSTGFMTVVDSVLYVVGMVVIAAICLVAARYILEGILEYLDDSVEKGRDSSFFPILVVVVNLVVILSFMYVILKHFGFDLMIIVTSMGIVGLAISFSAKTSLEQLFAGIGIILNGTIKTGDIVRFSSGNGETYRVVSIGMMATTFQNGDRSERITMPNNVLITSTLFNLTADDSVHEVTLTITVGDDRFDYEAVRRKVTEAACTVEHVITDGSYPMPSLKLVEYRDNGQFNVFIGDQAGPGLAAREGRAVTYRLKVFVDEADSMGAVKGNLTLAVSKAFSDEGRDVEVSPVNAGAETREAE